MRLDGSMLLIGAGAAALAMIGCASGTGGGDAAAMTQAEETRVMEQKETAQVMPEANPEVRAVVEPAAWHVREAEDRSLITGEEVRLTVHGMSCPKCANNIERQVERVVGVSTIDIDMGQGHVLVGFRPAVRPSPRDLARAIQNTGFTLVEIAER